jgi:hypothetical protein
VVESKFKSGKRAMGGDKRLATSRKIRIRQVPASTMNQVYISVPTVAAKGRFF